MLNLTYIGIGQCGNKFADEFGEKNNAIAINTTSKDMACLRNIPKNNMIEIAVSGTKGGAGKNPVIGKQGMLEHYDTVMDKINKTKEETDFYFICSGLGGGTGSGATPALINKMLEEDYNNFGLILTMPDLKEGVEVQSNAVKSILELFRIIQEYEIPVMLIDNQKIKNKMEKETNFDWRNVTQIIAKTFTQFNAVANRSSRYSTFDESDYKKTLMLGGIFVLSKTQIDVEELNTELSLKEKIIENWKNSYYVDFDYKTTQIFTSIVEAPTAFLEQKPSYKLLENSLNKLEEECGSVSPYRGIYSIEDKNTNYKRGSITVYNLLTGLSNPIEKIEEIYMKAKESNKAILEKRNKNKNFNFDQFGDLDNIFNDEDTSKKPKENSNNFFKI